MRHLEGVSNPTVAFVESSNILSPVTPEPKPTDDEPKWLTVVQHYVKSMKYGEVRIVVHNGRVTQIEHTEKLRLDTPADYEI